MKLDRHCHVAEGSVDSSLSLDEDIELCRSAGYQGLMITDHDTYNGWRYWEKEGSRKDFGDFVVLRGVEYDTRDGGHMLVVMPSGFRSARAYEVRGMKTAELIASVHHYGGILGPAHPYGEPFMSFMHAAAGKHNYYLADQFDFIETFNACEYPECNAAAKRMAEELKKPGFGGSDSHRKGAAAMGWTEIDGDVRNEDDLIRFVLNHKDAFHTGGEYYHHTTKETVGKFNVVFSYSFGAYNKTMSLIKTHERKEAARSLEKEHGIFRNGRHYTEL